MELEDTEEWIMNKIVVLQCFILVRQYGNTHRCPFVFYKIGNTMGIEGWLLCLGRSNKQESDKYRYEVQFHIVWV